MKRDAIEDRMYVGRVGCVLPYIVPRHVFCYRDKREFKNVQSTFVKYVGWFQGTGAYCIVYYNYLSTFQFFVCFPHLCILNLVILTFLTSVFSISRSITIINLNKEMSTF